VKKVLVLSQLQQIDTQLDSAQERLAHVDELLADRSSLEGAEAEHQAAEQATVEQ
jgi:hypothetical protein